MNFLSSKTKQAPLILWFFAIQCYCYAFITIVILAPTVRQLGAAYFSYVTSSQSFSPECYTLIYKSLAIGVPCLLGVGVWTTLLMLLPHALLKGITSAWFHSLSIWFATFICAAILSPASWLESAIGIFFLIAPLIQTKARAHCSISDNSKNEISSRLTKLLFLYFCAAMTWYYSGLQLQALADEIARQQCKLV